MIIVTKILISGERLFHGYGGEECTYRQLGAEVEGTNFCVGLPLFLRSRGTRAELLE